MFNDLKMWLQKILRVSDVDDNFNVVCTRALGRIYRRAHFRPLQQLRRLDPERGIFLAFESHCSINLAPGYSFGDFRYLHRIPVGSMTSQLLQERYTTQKPDLGQPARCQTSARSSRRTQLCGACGL